MLISLVAVTALFIFVDLTSLVRALRLADGRLFLAGVLLLLISLGIRAAAWRTILQEQATLSQAFFAINQGYLLNNLLPFRLGEIGRAFLLSRATQLSIWQVFSTILIERAFDVALAASLLLATVPFLLGVTGVRQAGITAGLLVLAGLTFLHLLARNQSRALSIFDGLRRRFPLLARFGADRLEAFFTGLQSLVSLRRFAWTFGWMALVWALTAVEYYLILLAFVPGAQFLWAAFALGVLAVGAAIPSSPATIGVFEASLVGALVLFSVDEAQALAFAIAIHLLFILTSGILGVIGLTKDGISLGGLYQRVREEMDRR